MAGGLIGDTLGRTGAGEEVMFVLAMELKVWTRDVMRGVTWDGLAWSMADEGGGTTIEGVGMGCGITGVRLTWGRDCEEATGVKSDAEVADPAMEDEEAIVDGSVGLPALMRDAAAADWVASGGGGARAEFWDSEVKRGLLVSVCANDMRSCWAAAGVLGSRAADGGGRGGVAGGTEDTDTDGWVLWATVLRRLWAKGDVRNGLFNMAELCCCCCCSCWWLVDPLEDAAASIPNWMIWARKNAFSFSKTAIWFWTKARALADFSASLAVLVSFSFLSMSSLRYSTVLSKTVPLLYTYCTTREIQFNTLTFTSTEEHLLQLLSPWWHPSFDNLALSWPVSWWGHWFGHAFFAQLNRHKIICVHISYKLEFEYTTYLHYELLSSVLLWICLTIIIM